MATVDRCDRELVHFADGAIDALRDRPKCRIGADARVVPGRDGIHAPGARSSGIGVALEVVAGRERSAGAGEQDDAHGVDI